MSTTTNDTFAAIYARLHEVLIEFDIPTEDISPDTELRAGLEIDSAELVEIVAAVAADRAPEGKQLSKVSTIGQLVELLDAQDA